jgi:DNA-binding PucR family transcriptional regulator
MEELGDLLKSLKAARTDAEQFYLRAQNVEACLKKIVETDASLASKILNHPDVSKLTKELMQELWFAKESSELRLAENLHAYL